MFVIDMKRILGIVLVMVLFTCTISLSAQQPYSIASQTTSEEGHILFSTAGPLDRRHTTIRLTNGSEEVMGQLNRYISKKLVQLVVPIMVIPVNHLNFTVTYNKNVLRPRACHSFYTSVASYNEGAVNESNTIINKPHSVIVKDFGGYFLFTRAHPMKLGPAKFMFVGSCEHVLLLT